MKIIRKTIIPIFSFFMLSCVCQRDNIVCKYDYSYFEDDEYIIRLSTREYSVLQDTLVSQDSCVISGIVYFKTDKSEHSGQIFGSEKDHYLGSWPHILIPSLKVDIIVTDGKYKITVPNGNYDIVVYARGYNPITIYAFCSGQQNHFIDIFLGRNSIK